MVVQSPITQFGPLRRGECGFVSALNFPKGARRTDRVVPYEHASTTWLSTLAYPEPGRQTRPGYRMCS